jgi:predicted membrane GTPase involved in stress response
MSLQRRIAGRNKGSVISMEKESDSHSIDKLQDRGKFSLNQMLKSTKGQVMVKTLVVMICV